MQLRDIIWKLCVLLYQIGIRCLGATLNENTEQIAELYQIGIRCLGATPAIAIDVRYDYIRLEFGV